MVALAPPVPGVGTFKWGSPAGLGVWNASGSCTVRGCPLFGPGSCTCALCRFPGAWNALTPATYEGITVIFNACRRFTGSEALLRETICTR